MLHAGSVSVALCTRNGQRYVERQIQSILAQSRVPNEIVVSDDASEDDTLSIVRATVDSYLAEHPGEVRLAVIHNPEPLGVAKNFEQALLACTGEIIMLSDQDDVWAPDRVERTLDAFRDTEVELVHGDARLVDADGEPMNSTLFGALGVTARVRAEIESNEAFELLLKRNLITGATAAVRARLVTLAVPVPPGWIHDEWLAIVAAASGRIRSIPRPLIDYRQHDANAIGATDLTLTGKLRRLVEPGADRNRRLLERARSLQERMSGLQGLSAARKRAVSHKLTHEEVRSRLGVHRMARLAPVLREAATGRYRDFGGGLQDIARDLIQPLGRAS